MGLKRAVSAYRAEIAALKRRTQAREQVLHRLGKGHCGAPVVAIEVSSHALRFRAKGLASERHRLALSADDYELLVGASGQSVCTRKTGQDHRRAKHMLAIAALRTSGKKKAAARLADCSPPVSALKPTPAALAPHRDVERP